MKKSLPCLAVLLKIVSACDAIAQPAADQPVAVSQSVAPIAAPSIATNTPEAVDQAVVGDRLLMQAASQLERRASVAARLRHQLSISGQELYGIGSYCQQGSGDELKVRLELQIAGQDARLLQVCNSRFLWVDRRLPSGRNVTRYDLRQLRADPALAPPSFDNLDPGKANWSAMQPFLIARSGGLPSLLISLRENFNFLPPQAMRLAIAPSDSAQPMNVPVFAVVGQWKPEKLAALLAKTEDPSQQDAAPKKSKKARPLPERVPQEVLLLVGQADLFPYRIEYRGLETPATANTEGPPIPYQLSVHPLVVLELSDVVFDAPIQAGQFDYTPGDADWVDQTATLIEKLHRQGAAQVATRPAGDNGVPSR
jgi:hypothetical protein